MTTSTWTVAAVDAATGASPTDLPGAVVRSVIWGLNEPGVADLEMRRTDTDLAEILDPTREIRISRDGTILLWGPAVRVEIDQDLARIQCADPAWYLTRRFFGRADRVNFLTNGDFEDGLTGWTASGTSAVIDPFRAVNAGRSVRLTSTSTGDNYLEQVHTHTQVHPDGDLLTIAAWVWIQSAGYSGNAASDLGLFVERRDPTDATILDIAGDKGDDNRALIDGTTPKDQWYRLETSIPFVKEGEKIHVRLYSPFGTVWWDLATLTEMESLSFIDQDMATIVRGIVLYAQDRYPGFSHGKSNLNLDPDIDPTGVTMSRTYQFADHANIDDELRKFTALRGGIDWRVVYPDSSHRLFVAGHPHLGVVRDDLTLAWDTNISKFRYSRDRVQQATSATVLGPGDGPDREEGGATLDAVAGPTLEDVSVAPDDTLPAALNLLADERLAVLTHPEILEVTCADIFGDVTVGDWVPVTIPDLVDDTYRVVRIAADPANDSLSLTLNLRDPETPEEAMARFPRAVDACLAPGGGVWVVGSDGGVGAYGGAAFHGSLPDDGIIPNAPVVAIVPHGAGGYWLVGADTGVFAYGDAPVREGYSGMIDTEYAAGDRAIVAAEAEDPDGVDTLIMLADDGSEYAGGIP